jgi:hydrogenase maturation protein HypF
LQAQSLTRVRLRVEGTVQGVGFRPYVYRLASSLRLGGWVLNDARGVLIEVQGSAAAVAEFAARLAPEAPPLALIERVSLLEAGEPQADLGCFQIRPSPSGERPDAPVTPDTATCEDCLRELFDPADRRYRYPFINCTNCGPRFTIVRGIPYDRPLTTMAAFRMCEACRAEYEDPSDRRFHAQPNACPECGPSVSLRAAGGRRPAGVFPDDPLEAAAIALRDGAIVAVKGIGGYHLACRADDEQAVARLRARKHREDKPFALMAASLAEAERLVALGEEERALLCSPARPIVLAPRLAGADVAKSVAPGAPELGVMLAYSPLHHLLLSDFAASGGQGPLVMTSGNVSDEPIAFKDADALARLSAIAELFLLHNREIETRTDDSVLRVVALAGAGGPRPGAARRRTPGAATSGAHGGAPPGGPGAARRPAIIRRSRGYVPASLPLPGGTPVPLLACGAELKSTFCLARGERAWVSHHIGDLENYETLRSFTDGIAHFQRLFDVRPEAVAHDLHPEYLSTKHALSLEGLEAIGVQHHHAHLAACLAEHGHEGPAIGAIFDGSGYGLDGTIWGGEILAGGVEGFERVGWLLQVPLPGGERAVREPWRMALSWLDAALDGDPQPPPALARAVAPERWRQLLGVARAGVASPQTSSVGRLFDAVAALCGVRACVNYEGQAAIELEGRCDPHERGAYELELRELPAEEGGAAAAGARPLPRLLLDPRPVIRAALADVRAGAPAGAIAARFHAGLARAAVAAVSRAAAQRGLGTAVLSGGVFQNRRLLEAVAAALGTAGLRVLVPALLPANDGGISFGQAAVAARAMRRR